MLVRTIIVLFSYQMPKFMRIPDGVVLLEDSDEGSTQTWTDLEEDVEVVIAKFAAGSLDKWERMTAEEGDAALYNACQAHTAKLKNVSVGVVYLCNGR